LSFVKSHEVSGSRIDLGAGVSHWLAQVVERARRVTRLGVAALVALLLLALAIQELAMVRDQSLTVDEGADFYAGYAIWKSRDYGLNAAHPPLVKMLATIPLLSLSLQAPPLPSRHLQADVCGRDFVFGNGPRYGADALIWRSRLVAGAFVLLLALLTFWAGREMFGARVGLLALALIVFDPNVLAHGMYVTTDVALSSLLFAAIYALYRYMDAPTLARLAVVGASAGLALATKHSAVMLAPMLSLLALGPIGAERRGVATHAPLRAWILRRAGVLTAILVAALLVLWAVYGFRYAARPPGLKLDPTLAQELGPLPHIEARIVALAARLHVLPEAWIYGLLDIHRIARSVPGYLLGKFYPQGPWFYFPVLLAMKLTLGSLGMLALTIWALATRQLRVSGQLYFLTVPAALFLLAAMASHLSQGIRHLLPLWPFLCILAAAGVSALIEHDRRWIWPVAALVALHAGSSLLAYPNYLSYSNEAWGGPSRTYQYVGDSNADWGQQLNSIREYLHRRGVRDCWIAYVAAPVVLPSDYGIPCKRLPTAGSIYADEQLPVPAVIHGPVFISTGELYALDYEATALNPYVSFRKAKPSAFIQDGILVFDGDSAVPELSSLSHIQASAALLRAQRYDEALAQARAAEALAPGQFRTEIAVGDALAAEHKFAQAREEYGRALGIAEAMDGSGRKVWVPQVQMRLAHEGGGTPSALIGGGPQACLN
jgi:4-amino-4-deoxy-L-arabinose transferase-like glycosyltransferase